MEALSLSSSPRPLLHITKSPFCPSKFASLPRSPKFSLTLPVLRPASSRSLHCSASISSSNAVVLQTPTEIQERSRLKLELLRAIQASEGSLSDECIAIVSSLEKLNPVPDITVDPGLVKGCLVQVKSNFKQIKKDAGGGKSLGYLGAVSTLGSTTFNMLKPIDLEIAMFDIYQHVSIESDDSYSFIVEITIQNADKEGSPVQGLIINRGRFAIGGPNRLDVEFLSCGMAPRYPEKDLDVWLKLLKEANPGMDENGSVIMPLPMPAKGWSDFLYMDEEIRIQKGNRGGVSVLRLLQEPVVSI